MSNPVYVIRQFKTYYINLYLACIFLSNIAFFIQVSMDLIKHVFDVLIYLRYIYTCIYICLTFGNVLVLATAAFRQTCYIEYPAKCNISTVHCKSVNSTLKC